MRKNTYFLFFSCGYVGDEIFIQGSPPVEFFGVKFRFYVSTPIFFIVFFSLKFYILSNFTHCIGKWFDFMQGVRSMLEF